MALGFLGVAGAVLGWSGCILGGPRAVLGGSWASLGGGLGLSWRRPGERLGAVLGHLGTSWRHLGASWRYLGAYFTWMVLCDRFLFDFMKIFRQVEHVKKASGPTKIKVLSAHAAFT